MEEKNDVGQVSKGIREHRDGAFKDEQGTIANKTSTIRKMGNVGRWRGYSPAGGSSMMIWRCLLGGNGKFSNKPPRGSNIVQPKISSGLRTCPSFTSILSEGMGGDSFSNIRYPHWHMPGEMCSPSRVRWSQHQDDQVRAPSLSLSLSSGHPPSHSHQSQLRTVCWTH